MFKKLKSIKLLELLILSALFFSLSILLGNLRLKSYLDTIIGNHIGITQNIKAMALDINDGKVITRIYPDRETLENIANLYEVDYMSVSTPAYIDQNNLSESNLLKHIKFIGTDQLFPYDLFIEKILLTEGRVFNQKEINSKTHVALISDSFAKENNLKVGDTYNIEASINDYNYEYEENHSHEHELEEEHAHDHELEHDIISIPIEVIGIFKANTTSAISQDAEESIFYTNLLSTNIYITNSFAKEINSKLLAKQIEAYPTNFENITDLYGELIKDKDKLIQHLESFQAYEIKIVPKNNRVTTQLKDKLTSSLKLFPYVKIVYNLERYEAYQILPQFIISIVIISFFSLIIYYLYSFSNIENTKLSIKQHILSMILAYILGLLLSIGCNNVFINFISQFSSKYPIQDDIPTYNSLDKFKLTSTNILELRSTPVAYEFLIYLSLIILALGLAYVIYVLKKYRFRNYVRLP